MIQLKTIEEKDKLDKATVHFILSTDRPMRVEVITTPDGVVVAHVYRGFKIKPEQEPVMTYDSSYTIPEPDEPWEVKG